MNARQQLLGARGQHGQGMHDCNVCKMPRDHARRLQVMPDPEKHARSNLPFLPVMRRRWRSAACYLLCLITICRIRILIQDHAEVFDMKAISTTERKPFILQTSQEQCQTRRLDFRAALSTSFFVHFAVSPIYSATAPSS